MINIIGLVGIPGSGKSTFAQKSLVASKAPHAQHPNTLVASRDAIRKSIPMGNHYYSRENEQYVQKFKTEHIRTFCKECSTNDSAPATIIIDETHCTVGSRNFTMSVVRELEQEYDIDFSWLFIQDSYNIDLCHQRNTARDGDAVVPYHRLEEMFTMFLDFARSEESEITKNSWLPSMSAVNNDITNSQTLQKAIIVDIDGTLATRSPKRGPFDWDKVYMDFPKKDIINLVQMLRTTGHHVIFVSGRDGSCELQTLDWLQKHVGYNIHPTDLFLRPEGSNKKDYEIKMKIYKDYILGNYQVEYVIDDRQQVCRYWRALGLTTLQVDSGLF